MKNDPATTISATKLQALVKKHAPAEMPPAPSDPVATLVQSFLLWEASSGHAVTAMERIAKDCVDLNELRVCLPEEIQIFLGMRYPCLEDRVDRLRRTLNDLYRREHKLSLAHVSSLGKREQRSYVENLDGMVPFVASRLMLLHFSQPGIPVDEQLCDLLLEAKVLPKQMSVLDLSHGLAKLAPSFEESLRMHLALVDFTDDAWKTDPKKVHKLKVARNQAIMAARREAQAALDAKLRVEAKAKADAEAKIQAELEAKARAEAKAKADAEAKIKMEKAKAAALAKAAQQAAAKAVRDAQRLAVQKAKIAAKQAEKLAAQQAKRKAIEAAKAAKAAKLAKAAAKAGKHAATKGAKKSAKAAPKPAKSGKSAKASKPAHHAKPAAKSAKSAHHAKKGAK